MDEAIFASAETKAAFRWVKARLTEGDTGNKRDSVDSVPDAAGDVVAEVVIRSGRERFTVTVIDELFLRV